MGPFVQVVLGQIISLFGNAALRFVLPLILLRQTGSAAVYGAATALALLPALAGTLAGGVLADRCRKARLVMVLDLAAAGLALGAAASADDLPVVLWAPAALCALYALQGLYQPVVRASLPLLLAGDRLVQGNAVIQLVDTLDELLGPLLGSALLGVMGLGPLLVLCGACFATSALLEWQIRIPGDRPQPRTQGKPDFAADLRESLTYLYHSRPELLRLAGIMALVNLVEIPAVVVGIPVVIVQYLGQSDVVLGAVQAVLSVGGLAGGALAGRSRHPLSDRQALGLLLGIAGLCAAMGVVLWVPPLACGGVALCGFGVMAAAMRFNVWFFARLQAVLPQAQLDRFMVRLVMGYPDFASQVNILRDRRTGDPLDAVDTVSSAAALLEMQAQARAVHVADALLEYITHLAEASRTHPLVTLGISPRGALAVCRMCRSRALMEGRDYVLPDDVAYIFSDVCAHRLILSAKARITETSASDVLAEVLAAVPRPDRI